MSVLPIDTTSTGKDGATYYHINIKLPLRSLTVMKRYSDFDQLVSNLSKDLGISVNDFPLELPPKKLISFRSGNLVNERKVGLTKFLNGLIRDTEFQNHPFVHEFLGLPINFKLSNSSVSASANGGGHIERFPSDFKSIDGNSWLQYTRQLKCSMLDSQQKPELLSSTEKIRAKENINNVIRPNLSKLENSLAYLFQLKQIDPLEKKKRQLMLSEISQELESLYSILQSNARAKRDLFEYSSRRVIGKQAEETNETLPLNNNELLQKQQQIHKQQDQEVEQLRKIIQRQRQIGEVINNEVTEQNEILDQLNEDVEKSSNKLKNARSRIRRIG